MSPCTSCIHYRVSIGSLHPIERWCAISGEWLSASDVWHNNPEAHTRVWGVKTNDIPECKFTMSAREVWEFDEWYASKMTLYYRENRGGYKGFSDDPRNDFWRYAFYGEQEVELNNSKRFWPGGDLHHFVQRKPRAIATDLEGPNG
jgi:hypothetical protein